VTSARESTEHVSDLSLDLAVQGELAEVDTRVMHAHLDACRECRERYEAVASDAAHFRRHVLPRTLDHVARRLGKSPAPGGRPRARALVGSMIASAAVAAAILLLIHRQPAGDDHPSGLRRKGGPELAIFARHGERVFRVGDGTHLEAGDTLRFQAEPSGAAYLMVASIDGTNHASIYVPYDGKTSLRIPEDRTFRDDAGIALDGARGPERIFALFSKRPLDSAAVTRALSNIGAGGHAAIRAGTHLEIPDADQVSLYIEK
jgi:hypothetical protein